MIHGIHDDDIWDVDYFHVVHKVTQYALIYITRGLVWLWEYDIFPPAWLALTILNLSRDIVQKTHHGFYNAMKYARQFWWDVFPRHFFDVWMNQCFILLCSQTPMKSIIMNLAHGTAFKVTGFSTAHLPRLDRYSCLPHSFTQCLTLLYASHTLSYMNTQSKIKWQKKLSVWAV